MRILHILYGVFMLALAFAVAREPVGRVAVIVFVTLAGELICGTTALMLLFQTVGSIGDALGALDYIQGLMAAAIVLVVASWLMIGMLYICGSIIGQVV
jgi:hypothetical protein